MGPALGAAVPWAASAPAQRPAVLLGKLTRAGAGASALTKPCRRCPPPAAPAPGALAPALALPHVPPCRARALLRSRRRQPRLAMSWALARRGLSKSPSALALETLESWQEKEARNQLQSAVDEDGSLLDNLTLELRVHPPSIEIDNGGHDKWTVVTIDSANRPGSLIYVRGRALGADVSLREGSPVPDPTPSGRARALE